MVIRKCSVIITLLSLCKQGWLKIFPHCCSDRAKPGVFFFLGFAFVFVNKSLCLLREDECMWYWNTVPWISWVCWSWFEGNINGLIDTINCAICFLWFIINMFFEPTCSEPNYKPLCTCLYVAELTVHLYFGLLKWKLFCLRYYVIKFLL